MNLFKKAMIFATFFLSCLSIALLVASLGTQQWVLARARRTSNPHESDGRINMGLFHGKKELNVAYGWRIYEIDGYQHMCCVMRYSILPLGVDFHERLFVHYALIFIIIVCALTSNASRIQMKYLIAEVLKTEEDFLIYSLWVGTVVCVCLGLLFAVKAAIFAVINTATNARKGLSGVPGLYSWNILALLADAAAVSQWIAQYYLKLQNNVMMSEDRKNMWTSEGMAELGMSFWFVVGATIVSFVNILVIYIGTSETREPEPVLPMLEEKTNGAIMLY